MNNDYYEMQKIVSGWIEQHFPDAAQVECRSSEADFEAGLWVNFSAKINHANVLFHVEYVTDAVKDFEVRHE